MINKADCIIDRKKKILIVSSLAIATIAALVVALCTDGKTSSTDLKVSPFPAFLLLMIAALIRNRNNNDE